MWMAAAQTPGVFAGALAGGWPRLCAGMHGPLSCGGQRRSVGRPLRLDGGARAVDWPAVLLADWLWSCVILWRKGKRSPSKITYMSQGKHLKDTWVLVVFVPPRGGGRSKKKQELGDLRSCHRAPEKFTLGGRGGLDASFSGRPPPQEGPLTPPKHVRAHRGSE